jgi:hypothetical protein
MTDKVCNQWNCRRTDCEHHMARLERFDQPIQPTDLRGTEDCEEVVEG